MAARIFLGRRLRESFRAWLKAKSLRDPLPTNETADLLAAIVRRVVRVGVVGLVLAALPGGFLLWQSLLLQEQNAAIRIQIEQQASDTQIVRRAQLLATIYECEEAPEAVDPAKKTSEPIVFVVDINEESWSAAVSPCRPRAHPRARQEAVLAFCDIERGRGARPDIHGATLAELDLHGADLSWANLKNADLSEADLGGANLRDAYLTRANLRGAELGPVSLFDSSDFESDKIFVKADLSRAMLIGANLREADLSYAKLNEANLSVALLVGADLTKADLTKADLSGAKLRKAKLREADFSGADLREAKNLTQDQIDSALGDLETRLPEGLKRPESWAE